MSNVKPENVKTESQATALREKAHEQAAAITRSALALAETLFAIKYSVVKIGNQEKPLVEVWKHENFHEFAEHELGMHGTTAENYVHVHDILILGEGFKSEQLPTSITKLIQLSRIAKKQGLNAKAWIKRAHEMSCCEFQAAVEKTLTGKDVVHRQWSFWMSNRDIRTIERGLKRAKEILGTKHNGETLAGVIDEWVKVADSTGKLRPTLRVMRKAG